MLGAWTTLQAQQIPEPERKYSLFSKPDVEKDEETVDVETSITTRIELPGIRIVPCQAQVALAYYQRNDIARVNAGITHKDCSLVEGTFEILVSVRDDNGELVRHTFPETFSLDGNGKLEFTRDYPIGENVTLSSVRSRDVQCTCGDSAAQ